MTVFNPACRIEAVQVPVIPVIADLVDHNPGTISLAQGVVHYGPPPQALAEIERFAADPRNHVYQDVIGIPELRAAIRLKLGTDNMIDAEGNAVVVTAGSNMGFLNAVLAIADTGDEIVLLKPYYFNHEMAVRIAGCRPVLVATDSTFQPDLVALRAALTARTRAIVTVTPNNPTGVVYGETVVGEINRLCLDAGIYHISDETYEYFTDDGARHFSPAAIAASAAHTISLFSLSKAYGLASWRIGYMVVPVRLLESVNKIQDTNLICPPVISQYAAVGALTAGRAYCASYVAEYNDLRQRVLKRLAPLAGVLKVSPAAGAFYFMLSARSTDMDSMTLARRLIEEHRIATVPGSAFGMEHPCSLRISYGALQPATAAEGIGRLADGLDALLCG